MEHARARVLRRSLRTHRQWQGRHGAQEFALPGREQDCADDRRQTADPERSGGGVLPGSRDPLDSVDAARIQAVLRELSPRHCAIVNLNSRPPFTTTSTFSSTLMSLSGSPFTAMTSPNFPSSMVPTSLAQPM